jgi:hypothetical protein
MLPAMPIYVTQWMQRRPQQAGLANRRRRFLFPYYTVPPAPWLTAEMLAAAAERACSVPADSIASDRASGDGWRRLLLGWLLSEGGACPTPACGDTPTTARLVSMSIKAWDFPISRVTVALRVRMRAVIHAQRSHNASRKARTAGEISAESAAWLCTDLSYLYELLVRGMHVPTNSPIHLISDAPPNLVGVEVAWILGDALLSLQVGMHCNSRSLFAEQKPHAPRAPHVASCVLCLETEVGGTGSYGRTRRATTSTFPRYSRGNLELWLPRIARTRPVVLGDEACAAVCPPCLLTSDGELRDQA